MKHEISFELLVGGYGNSTSKLALATINFELTLNKATGNPKSYIILWFARDLEHHWTHYVHLHVDNSSYTIAWPVTHFTFNSLLFKQSLWRTFPRCLIAIIRKSIKANLIINELSYSKLTLDLFLVLDSSKNELSDLVYLFLQQFFEILSILHVVILTDAL